MLKNYQLARDSLARMSDCLSQQQLAYQGFLVLAQEFDWRGAEDCRLRAVASMEATMDHYVSACRAMGEGKAHGAS